MTADEVAAIESFKRLGLTGYEAKAFLALQQLESGTARDVARVADVPRSQVYSVADSLAERGLIEVQQSTPRRFRPVSVEQARRTLRERFETEHERAFSYAEQVREEASGGEEQENIWTIRGQTHVTDRTLDHISQATQRIDYGARLPELLSEPIADALCERAAAGVDVAVVSESEAVREQFADDSEVTAFEPPGPHAEDDRSGRIVLVDDDRLLFSVVDDDGSETAISSAESLFAHVLIELVQASSTLREQ